MTTTIGSVTLDRDMVFEDEYIYKLVSASVTPTLGGGQIVQEFSALEKGRLVTLISTETQGLQLKSTINDLMDLAAVVEATYTLSISSSNGESFSKTVRFRNDVDGGAVQFKPMQDRDGLHADTVYYKGTIYLMVM